VRFDPTVTSETWIELDSRKFDIVTVTNLDERKEFQLLLCRERGSNTQPVNFA
jgi:head-tail adaptor